MGLIVNKPATELRFSDLLEQLGVDRPGRRGRDVRVHFGGPVEPGRGFVLHPLPEGEAEDEGLLRIPGLRLGMTTTRNILEDIARGRGPDRAVLSLGYAGWDAGQLEAEMMANGERCAMVAKAITGALLLTRATM